MRARASWIVQAGVIPGVPEPDYRKEWWYTGGEATAGETPGAHPEKPPQGKEVVLAPTIFETYRKEAVAYYETLNNPRVLNWADLNFMWY